MDDEIGSASNKNPFSNAEQWRWIRKDILRTIAKVSIWTQFRIQIRTQSRTSRTFYENNGTAQSYETKKVPEPIGSTLCESLRIQVEDLRIRNKLSRLQGYGTGYRTCKELVTRDRNGPSPFIAYIVRRSSKIKVNSDKILSITLVIYF